MKMETVEMFKKVNQKSEDVLDIDIDNAKLTEEEKACSRKALKHLKEARALKYLHIDLELRESPQKLFNVGEKT